MIKKIEELKFSVMIPVYNMDKTIKETIESVLNQAYKNFEIIVQDNSSSDNTSGVVKLFNDSRIKYFRNDTNIGYARNLIAGRKNCQGDILYFLGADDILSENALLETAEAFLLDDDIGAVTRPYLFFQEDINVPVRITPRLNSEKNEIIYIKDYKKAIYAMHNEILGQLSGLAFRMKYLKDSFFTRENDWIAHGYPFANIFKNHPVIFLKNYQLAVRIGYNSIRQKGNTCYKVSPTKRWVDMLNETFYEEEYQEFKNYFIKKIIASNYIGLIQIRCYSCFRFLLREVGYLLRYKWSNIFNLKFWFFSFGCIVMPKLVLARMVDWYKNKINSKMIKGVSFKYNIIHN
jgi:glycosyltransferase involved in cell wall biosynthesis